MNIKKLDYEFVCQYEFWLKSVRNCNHNTAIKYISNFRKIVNCCIRNGWLERDPFVGFKMTKKEAVPEFLTEHELNQIATKKFNSERLKQIRDVFLFCCYTGLAFADVEKLKPSEIGIGIDGKKWIFTNRQKPDTLSRIPLLPIATDILERYKDHPSCITSIRYCRFLVTRSIITSEKEIPVQYCGESATLARLA
jgi:site-specific recombinase XerD